MILTKEQLIDVFDGNVCGSSGTALGRKMRSQCQIEEIEELMDPTDDLMMFINGEII